MLAEINLPHLFPACEQTDTPLHLGASLPELIIETWLKRAAGKPLGPGPALLCSALGFYGDAFSSREEMFVQFGDGAASGRANCCWLEKMSEWQRGTFYRRFNGGTAGIRTGVEVVFTAPVSLDTVLVWGRLFFSSPEMIPLWRLCRIEGVNWINSLSWWGIINISEVI